MLDETRIQLKEDEIVEQELLKKYIIYARKFVHPKLNDRDREKVTKFYSDIRRESAVVGGMNIAVRHIESVLRMSEAHAKLHLRDYVRSEDIDVGIEMLLDSFLQSQKIVVARQLSKKFQTYKAKSSETSTLLMHTLGKLIKERAVYNRFTNNLDDDAAVEVAIPMELFENSVHDFNVHDMMQFYKSSAFDSDFVIDKRQIKTRQPI